MKKLIKRILREDLQVLNEAPIQGAKISAKICEPKGNETTGIYNDNFFIVICGGGAPCATPVVGDFMISRAATGTGAFLNYDTSWVITSVNSYGTKEATRERYHSCTFGAGCMDPQACNYDPSATSDDGSCYTPECSHNGALNYVPGSIYGCNCGSPPFSDCCNFPSFSCDYAGGCSDPGDGSGTFKAYDTTGSNPTAGTSPTNGVSYTYASTFNGATSYAQAAYNDCLQNCQPQPTTYDCVDGSCVAAPGAGGQYPTEEDCLVGCSLCAHSECFHCPGPGQTKAQDDFLQKELSEKVQTPTQGCKVVGTQWLQVLTSGISLYNTKIECETAESGCSTKEAGPTETCHCCDGQGNVQVMPAQYAVGQCPNIPNIGASLNPNSWLSYNWFNCSPVSQPISCGEEPQSGVARAKKAQKGNTETQVSVDVENISEDVKRMKGLIKY